MKKLLIKTYFMILSCILALSTITSCAGNGFEIMDFLSDTETAPYEFVTLKKEEGKDFVILNLSDTQMTDAEWNDGEMSREILEYTIDELIKKTQPDLITISGDVAWSTEMLSYEKLADLLESYGIPWSVVWGNHDNESGLDRVDEIEELYLGYENCIYFEGAPELGSGNFVIQIEEKGKPVTGEIMMDTHDHDWYILGEGERVSGYSKWYDEQKLWYIDTVKYMESCGYKDSMIIQHIPIYAYKYAFNEAFKADIDPSSITWEQSYEDEYWNEGYKDSYGVRYESGGFPPVEDGVLDLLIKQNHTKYMISGHDHVNNFVINYKGIKLVYALKTGMGCYWEQSLNGGTVIKINSEGIYDLHHEYVNVDHIVEAHSSNEE